MQKEIEKFGGAETVLAIFIPPLHTHIAPYLPKHAYPVATRSQTRMREIAPFHTNSLRPH